MFDPSQKPVSPIATKAEFSDPNSVRENSPAPYPNRPGEGGFF